MSLSLRRLNADRPVISPLGLDVGPRHLRAAQLERRGRQWRVLLAVGWRRRESETGPAVIDGFSKRIRQSLEQAGYRGRRVVAGLSIPEVELHALEIPERGDLQDAGKFREAVRWELERVGSIRAAESEAAYWRLPSSKRTRTTAIGAVARSPDVTAVEDLTQSLGLDCEQVDATACAIARLGAALRRGDSVDPQEVWSVMDIGYRMLRLVLCVGEVPVLVRYLDLGGQRWTENLAESLGLSPEAAEIHKRDYGIATDASRDAPEASSEIAAMIYKVLRPDFEAIVAEVERSYEYVMRCYPECPAGAMLAVGGGADLKGLVPYLSTELGIEVRCLQEAVSRPGSSLAGPPAMRESLNPFGCAIGLAIDSEPSA